MMHPAINRWFSKGFSQQPLPTFLVLPFVIQIVAAVGVVGLLSWHAGQAAVNGLATQAMGEITDRTGQHLETYTNVPLKVVNVIASDLESGQIRLDGKDLQPFDAYLLNRLRTFNEVSFVAIGTSDKKFMGVGTNRASAPTDTLTETLEVADSTTKRARLSYHLNGAGMRVQKIGELPNYDVKQEPWYQAAVDRQRLAWNEINVATDRPNPGLTLTASKPYYRAGQLAGVATADLVLADINIFLNNLPLRRSGQIFILESNGNLVSSSSSQPLYRSTGSTIERINAIDSPNSVIRATMQELKNRTDLASSFQAKIDGQKRFVRVTPWRDRYGLSWRLVVVLPTSDFQPQIDRNIQNTLLLCGLTFLGTIGLSYATSRRIRKPILSLNQAAKQLAQGNRYQPIVGQSRELGELVHSLNHMAAKLHNSLTNLKTLNQELFNSKQRLYQLLEALPVGVIVFDPQGECLFLNRTGQLLLGIKQVPNVPLEEMSTAYRIFRSGTREVYPTAELPIVQALNGRAIYLDDLEIRVRNMTIPLEVRAIPVLDTSGQVLYAIQTFQNVTARKQAEAARRFSEHRMQRLIDNVPGVIYRLVVRPDGSHRFTYIGPRCRELLGVEPEAALHDAQVLWSQILPEDELEFRRLLPVRSRALQPWSFEYRVRLEDGTIKWIQNQASPEAGENGDVYWDGLILNITERKQAEEVLSDYRYHLEQQVQERTIALQEANQELERLATLDGLTQVANRRRFDLYLAQEWQRLSRDQQLLSLILCDVDYFKHYNDYYGHQAGDYCLKAIANVMNNVVKRPADLLARYGGEEFAVILPHTNRWGAMQVAEALRQEIFNQEIIHAHSDVSQFVTLSVGVATVLPSQMTSIEDLIAQTDRALYQAKRQGRNRVCFAEMKMASAS